MPVMTGEETIRALRSCGYSGLVVGLTGYAMEEDVNRFKAAGLDAIFSKPLDVAALTKLLQSTKATQ